MRRHGWLLPLFVGLFLGLLFWAAALPVGPAEVARGTVTMICFPVGMAFFVGFGMGKTGFWARELRLSSFLATRPLGCAELALAKLQAAGLSALAAYGLVVLLAPVWMMASGNAATVAALGDAWFHDQPLWKLGILLPVALAGLVGLTWLQLVAGMCLSLTGRVAVVNGVVVLYLAVGTTLASLGIWTAEHPDFVDTLRMVLWCLGGALCLLKAGVAAWVWSRYALRRQPTALRLALVWLAVTAAVLVPLYVLVPSHLGPPHLIALYLVLALPFTRLTALPAALAWNRHR
jgi:hypothetical protein